MYDVLQKGYIKVLQNLKSLIIRMNLDELKYVDGQPVIKSISRVSKPGRRVYSNIKDLQKL